VGGRLGRRSLSFLFVASGECAMIHMLAVILVLVGAAASAIMVIVMWDVGAPVLRRWRRRNWTS